MFILGLTGSVAMGKSTAAGMFRSLGVPVFDADASVHALLGRGGAAVADVAAAFLGVVRDGAVDRALLAARVFSDEAELRRLEAIVHPHVRARQRRFLMFARRRGETLAVLDIPLLFETGAERCCDAVAVVTAPRFVQMQRLRARPGMDGRRIDAVLARQMADAEKRRRADVLIPSGLGRAVTFRAIRRIVARCRSGVMPSRRRGARRCPVDGGPAPS